MLDLAAIAATPLRSEPYDWGYAPHAIPRPAAARLLATFPQDGFWQLHAHDGEKQYRYAARPLVTLGATCAAAPEGLHPAWRAVAEQLVSPGYRSALSRATGSALDGALMEASVWRWGTDAQLGPHLDLASKIVTQVVYLNVGWDSAWGGCLRILGSRDPQDTFRELPPSLGSASTLVRSERSWHSVTPVQPGAGAERRSLLVTWLHPGSSSPVWAVGPGGEVTCTASDVALAPFDD